MVDFGISFAYLISTIIGLAGAYFINKASPNLSPLVGYFVLPILLIYVSLKILQFLFPHIGTFAKDAKHYLELKSLGEINNMGYYEVFPVLFAVLIVFLILLFGGAFGGGGGKHHHYEYRKVAVNNE